MAYNYPYFDESSFTLEDLYRLFEDLLTLTDVPVCEQHRDKAPRRRQGFKGRAERANSFTPRYLHLRLLRE